MIPREKSEMKAEKKKVMAVTFFVLFIVNYVKNNPNLHRKLPLFIIFLFYYTFFPQLSRSCVVSVQVSKWSDNSSYR